MTKPFALFSLLLLCLFAGVAGEAASLDAAAVQTLKSMPKSQLQGMAQSLNADEQKFLMESVAGAPGAAGPVSGAAKPAPDRGEDLRDGGPSGRLDRRLEVPPVTPPVAPPVAETKLNSVFSSFPPGLSLFGTETFAAKSATFGVEPLIAVPGDYVLGPGDTFTVHLSGKEIREVPLSIDRDGMVVFPKIGIFPVAGLRFSEFKTMLSNRVQQKLIGFELAHITMGSLRTIRIFLLGEVEQPGTHIVSSLASIGNVLFSTGGFKPIGSLRNIQLSRGGQRIQTFDLYDWLLKGKLGSEVRLQDGDTIFVSPIGKTIAVVGKVKRPAIYELSAEKTVSDVISLVGGLLPDADESLVQIERVDQQRRRILLDLDLGKHKDARTHVQSGDTIRVAPVADKKQNVVRLQGHAFRTGEFQWFPGMHVADLLPPTALLRSQTDLSYALLVRKNLLHGKFDTISFRLGRALEDNSSPDNLALRPDDSISIFSLGEDRAKTVTGLVSSLRSQGRYDALEGILTIVGNVRFPGTYPFVPDMGMKKLLSAAGSIKVNTDMNYCLIVRSEQSGRIRPFSVQLKKILQQEGEDVFLQPHDHVFVFGQDSHSSDDFWEQSLAGSTAKSEKLGRFLTSESSKDEQAMDIAQADSLKIDPKKKSGDSKNSGYTRKELLQPVLTKLKDQATSEEPAQITMVGGAVRFPGEYPLERGMRISDLLRAGGGLHESAYKLDADVTRLVNEGGKLRQVHHIRVAFPDVLRGDPSADLALQPHDILLIKELPQWGLLQRVTLSGLVRFPGVYPIQPGETLKMLVERAGGLNDFAFPEGALFTRESLRQREEKERNALISRLEGDLVQATAEENKALGKTQTTNVGMLRSLIAKLKATEVVGRLAVDLPAILSGKADPGSDVLLRDGDSLLIPQRSNEVTVMGEVLFPTSHQYQAQRSVEDFIRLSGGYASNADKDNVYLVKANGQIVSKNSGQQPLVTSWFTGRSELQIGPADTVVVPMNLQEGTPMVFWKDITQILYNLAVSATALKTAGAL